MFFIISFEQKWNVCYIQIVYNMMTNVLTCIDRVLQSSYDLDMFGAELFYKALVLYYAVLLQDFVLIKTK